MRVVLSVSLLLGVMVLSVSGSASAQQNDVPGSSDYGAIERFPGSEISNYQQIEDTIYELALGRLRRSDGQVSPTRAERLRGELTRITYAIPSGFSAEEVYAHYREQLLTGAQPELFECQGRDCGSSNFWANQMFDNRVLYGPAGNQFYSAATYQTMRDGQQVSGYAALYAITRANRRVYAHIDFLQLPADEAGDVSVTPEAIMQRLNQEGSVVVQNIAFDDNDELIDEGGVSLLVETLRRDTLLEVMLVAHLREPGDTGMLRERSTRRAEQVRNSVVEEGIEPERITAHGVGPLAPFCRPQPCANRVELVLRP